MDDQHSQKNETLNLTLQGITIQPGRISSRPSSAKSNSQSKQPLTPSRGGSAKEPKTSTSINLSSARERRLSNSGQRSLLLTSPSPDAKKSRASSTTSSVFHVLSPHHHDVDGFFTDQSQQKSLREKSDDDDVDDEWDETRRWVDELHPFIPPSPLQQQDQEQTLGVGPLGMSRDSLNGTVTGTQLFQSIDHRREQPMPPLESVNAEHVSPSEADLNAEVASITNQHSHEEYHTEGERPSTEQEKSISIEQQKPAEADEQRPIRIASAKENIQQENNDHNRSSHSRPPSARSTPRQRRTPIPSPLPPSSHIDERIRSVSSITSSSTSTLTSKVTLDEVYETLKRLEEVEQFPIKPPLENDSVYLIDPTASIPSPFIDELPLQVPNQSDSLGSNPDEMNQYDLIVASVRSRKSTARRTPSPRTIRPSTPPQSARRQQHPIKVAQSLSIPHSRASSTIEQRTKAATAAPPYKSLIVDGHSRTARDDDLKTSNRSTQNSIKKDVQSRINNEDNQRQPIIIQSRLNHQHELTDRYGNDSARGFDYQLQVQRDEYEAAIQRHLKFIDQLVDDKRKLSDRCEYLVSELKSIDKRCHDRIRAVEDIHRNELQKLKDVHDEAEKLRRERWIEEKTKKIKELTVRGLEPEIQKLISKHKNELSKTKAVHEAELLAADERAAQRYIRMTEELRDQLEREKEVAIARERELAREKYERSLRDEEKSYTEQRRRLYAEIEEEKNRQAEVAVKQRADLDKLRRDIEENHRAVVESTKREYEATRLEQEHRHTNEVQELKEKLTLEKQNWEEKYMKQQETLLASKERELREQLKHDRDKEIEKIIAKFESDTTATKEEAERTAENRVKRLREKYEAEFRELENSEQQMKERYNQTRVQLTEVEGERDRLQVLLKQKEAEINDIRKITETLQQERERLSETVRQEFADRLVFTEEENRRVKGEMAELRARQQLELEKKKEEYQLLKQQQEKELETIHEKIKQAITKKDEQVHALRGQYETAVKRITHLEGLLAQQRKLISTGPSSGSSASKKTQH